jgi:protein-S-isoprenylcysteine O-methyltransferase Ste14
MIEPLAIAAGVILYGAVHSLLASVAVKQWARSHFGPRTDRFYRLAYNAFAVVSFVPVLALLAWLPGTRIYQLRLPWSALALTGQAAALMALTAGLLQADPWSFLGLRQVAEGPNAEPVHLMVTGLYRWVRHPLYTAGLLLIWLTPVMTTSILALNLALTLYIMVGSRLEERRLAAEFGQAYANYQAAVPGLIPRPPRSSGPRQS